MKKKLCTIKSNKTNTCSYKNYPFKYTTLKSLPEKFSLGLVVSFISLFPVSSDVA